MDTANPVQLGNLKKGEYFIRKPSSNVVYVRGDYDRSQGKYECTKFDDTNSSTFF